MPETARESHMRRSVLGRRVVERRSWMYTSPQIFKERVYTNARGHSGHCKAKRALDEVTKNTACMNQGSKGLEMSPQGDAFLATYSRALGAVDLFSSAGLLRL
jgi:hypothetical protein